MESWCVWWQSNDFKWWTGHDEDDSVCSNRGTLYLRVHLKQWPLGCHGFFSIASGSNSVWDMMVLIIGGHYATAICHSGPPPPSHSLKKTIVIQHWSELLCKAWGPLLWQTFGTGQIKYSSPSAASGSECVGAPIYLSGWIIWSCVGLLQKHGLACKQTLGHAGSHSRHTFCRRLEIWAKVKIGIYVILINNILAFSLLWVAQLNQLIRKVISFLH